MKMKWMILLLVLLLSMSVMAQIKTRSEALDILKQYLALDYEGARLSSETSGKTFQLVGWFEEPGWDEEILVSSYEVIKEIYAENEARITVRYTIVGRWIGERIELSNKTEEIEFLLQKKQGVWLIVDPQIKPHVGVCITVRYMKDLAERQKWEKEQKERFYLEVKKLLDICNDAKK